MLNFLSIIIVQKSALFRRTYMLKNLEVLCALKSTYLQTVQKKTVYMCMCVYICTHREREKEREKHKCGK